MKTNVQDAAVHDATIVTTLRRAQSGPLVLADRTGRDGQGLAEALTRTKATVIVVAGTSGTSLARGAIIRVLSHSGLHIAVGADEALQVAPELRASDRIVLTWSPGDGPPPARADIVALTTLRWDELPPFTSARGALDEVVQLTRMARKAVVANVEQPLAVGVAAAAGTAAHITGDIDPTAVATVHGGTLVVRHPVTLARNVFPLDGLQLTSPVYRSPVAVGVAAALLCGGQMDAVGSALRGPLAAPGLTDLGKRRGVRWLCDAAATSPGRCYPALSLRDGPLLLLAGGIYDDQPLARWSRMVDAARYALLFGPGAQALADAARGRTSVVRCADLEDAVVAAGRLADTGDTVAFSPGCRPERDDGHMDERLADLLGLRAAWRHEAA